MLKDTAFVQYTFSDMHSNSYEQYTDELMAIYESKFDYIERAKDELVPALTSCGRIPICIFDLKIILTLIKF